MYKSNNFVIVNQNIRSMRQNFNLFLSDLESTSLCPDLIVLTETWIGKTELCHYRIEGYNMFARCNEGYRAGGTIVYVRDCYQCNGVRERDDVRSADLLQLEVRVNDLEHFTLLAVYRLHSSSRSDFTNDIDILLAEFDGRNIIFVGDMNFDILNQTTETDNYLSLLASRGMHNLVNEPTRIVGNSATCIDHAFVRFYNKKRSINYDYKSKVYHYDFTDHSTVVFTIIFNNIVTNFCGDCFEKVNMDKFAHALSSVDWVNVYANDSINEAFQTFINILGFVLDSCKSRVVVRKDMFKLKPWTTDRLLYKIKKRKKIYKLLRKNPNNLKIKHYYNNFRTQLNIDIKTAKEFYYNTKFENCAGDVKSQWKIVNDLIGEHRNKCEINCIKSDNGLLTNDVEIANEFNQYFLGVAHKLRSGINSPHIQHNPDYNTFFSQRLNFKSSFFLRPTTTEEVSAVIHSLKNNKAPGFDNINSSVVKKIAPNIINVLTYLYNFSLSTGEFPQCLKKANVIPIFKRGDCSDPNCYRPISLLSVFAKILEKIVKSRLMEFLNKNNYFSSNQFGFREGMSTEDALLTFMENVYSSINQNKKVSALFIDLTKAFDTVDHGVLFEKLWWTGVRGLPLNWFTSYLSRREQSVRIGMCLSDPGSLEYGVPQGSVLGPILFLIYMNDLCNGRFNGRLVAFADDTAFIYEHQNLNSLYDAMNEDLYFLRLWFDKNYMILSEKTKFMLFSLRKDLKFDEPLKFHGSDCRSLNNGNNCCNCLVIDQVSNIKYLGLVIDSQLSWRDHVNKLKRELYISLRKFYLLNQMCHRNNVLVNVYHALVGSRLCYGLTCWGGTYNSTLYPLSIFQKRFIRVISGMGKFEHTWPAFVSMKILPLRHLYIFKVLKMFFIRSTSYSTTRKMNYNFRKNEVVFVPKSYLTAHQIFYSSVAPRLFNIIKYKLTVFNNVNQFLNKLKVWLLGQESADYLLKIIS